MLWLSSSEPQLLGVLYHILVIYATFLYEEQQVKVSAIVTVLNEKGSIERLLQSLEAQTRPPDELVVCDDVSGDGTPEVVEAFAAEAPFPVRLIVNEENLGATKNFEKAVGLTGGDVIALSDQDDVWLPAKLERIEAALAESPGAGFVFTDAECAGEDLRPLGYRLWPSSYLGRRQLKKIRAGGMFELLLTHNVVTGATMAFRSEFRELVLPIHAGWVHDGWIALLISAVADVVALDEPLVKYRQHTRQQIGAHEPTLRRQYRHARTMGREYFAREAGNFAAALERLTSGGDRPVRADLLERLTAKVAHGAARLRMREVSRLGRLPLIARELLTGRYRRYSINWKAVPQDPAPMPQVQGQEGPAVRLHEHPHRPAAAGRGREGARQGPACQGCRQGPRPGRRARPGHHREASGHQGQAPDRDRAGRLANRRPPR